MLKEKILQQVGPRSSAASSSSAAPRKSRLFPERPLLTLDFLPPTRSDERIGPLGAIPVPSQESAVIDDLLYCLIGVEGTHLKPVRSASGAVSIQVDPPLDASLRELLARITPLCSHYSNVVQGRILYK